MPLRWAMKTGENWIARNSDTQLLLITCEQMDRRTDLITKIHETSEWRLYRALHDLEKMISSNLSMLGFTPTDRTRLGIAEVKAASKLEELMRKKAERVASTVADTSPSKSDWIRWRGICHWLCRSLWRCNQRLNCRQSRRAHLRVMWSESTGRLLCVVTGMFFSVENHSGLR